MREIRIRPTGRSVVAILCAACFLTVSLGAVSRATAADTFETWPRKPTDVGVVPKPATGAAEAGREAGKKVETGTSYGTIGWVAAGAAAVLGIAIAAGGGGSTSKH